MPHIAFPGALRGSHLTWGHGLVEGLHGGGWRGGWISAAVACRHVQQVCVARRGNNHACVDLKRVQANVVV